MLLSIALCTYNGARYLPTQLESLLLQTRPADEIIISDDCSTDETWVLLEAFKANYPGAVRLLKNDTNLGYGENFKQAILQCSGQYIFPCDQDDSWYPHKIETFLKSWEKQPTAMGWFCNADITNPGESQTSLSIWDVVYGSVNLPAETTPQQYFPMLVMNHSFILGATMAITREAAHKAFAHPWVNGFHFHDYHLALHLSLFNRLQPLPRCLQLWKQHGEQQTGAAGYLAKKQDILIARKAWLEGWHGNGDELEICRYWAFGLMEMEKQRNYWEAVSNSHYNDALQIVTEKLSNSKKAYFSSIPWAPRKKKLLKHWLKGGEYLRISAKEVWTL
jgi:glycosyltransferase involved in cell wall biosynthesis